MTEPEVSLYIAMYYIKNGLTKNHVRVSIDGAHVKTGNTIHFDIWKFFSDNDFIKLDSRVIDMIFDTAMRNYENLEDFQTTRKI